MGTFTVHHWTDRPAGLRELRRVSKRQVLVVQTHEAIISQEQFRFAQTLFDRNKRATTRKAGEGHRYILAGLVNCGVCGRRMHYSPDGSVAVNAQPRGVHVRVGGTIRTS